MDIWGKDIPGRRKRKFKGLEFRNRPRVTQKTQPRATGGMGGAEFEAEGSGREQGQVVGLWRPWEELRFERNEEPF